MAENDRQNQTPAADGTPRDGRFRNRQTRGGEEQAVRQGRTEILRSRSGGQTTPERGRIPDRNPVDVPASGREQTPPPAASKRPDSRTERRRVPDQDLTPVRPAASGREQTAHSSGSPRRTAEEKRTGDERKFYFQPLREISTLRKMLIVVFGLLFVWCVVPAFFHIVSIGVISSSLVMLTVCLTALFWHLIDRRWTWKKAAVVSLAGLLFAACVVAFSIVSGLMLKASLTAVPSGCADYTVVVLGCKAHGSEPSWMLSDRLAKAYSILTANPDVKCVVTGGKGDDEQYTEAYVMKKYLMDRGIPEERIYTEELSENTEQNLLYTRSLIELNGLSENIVIVTDRFHELRARMWAEKSGFRHIYSGCCETRIYLVTGYWFREMFGLARLYIFGV